MFYYLFSVFSSEFLKNSKWVCLFSVPNQAFKYVLGRCLQTTNSMTKHGLGVDYLREMFSATYKSILSAPREKSEGAKSFIQLMAPDRSFWCYHREECRHYSGICKLPPLWDLSTNVAPHSGTTFPLYFMETISILSPLVGLLESQTLP